MSAHRRLRCACLGAALLVVSCSDDQGTSTVSGEKEGTAGAGGEPALSLGGSLGIGAAGSSGAPGAGAGSSSGGASSGGASASGGVPAGVEPGQQPLGSVCVEDQQCNQDEGAAVCCVAPGCSGPCECRLEDACSAAGREHVCSTSADCGDKVCCEVDFGGVKQRACLPAASCTGTKL